LQLDNREIIAAHLMPPGELSSMMLTKPVAAYLERRRQADRGCCLANQPLTQAG
jgi:hypothetical protein